MFQSRQRIILELLKKYKYLRISKMAEILHYSTSTVRRDLIALEQQNLVQRVNGGALLIESKFTEAPVDIKKRIHLDEKRHIGALASNLINKNQSIFIDGSSTTFNLCQFLDPSLNLTLYTTNIDTAGYLIRNYSNFSVTIFGGELYDFEAGGNQTIVQLQQHVFDIAFLSCRGLDKKFGITDRLEKEAILKRTLENHAKKIVLLIDDSKFDEVLNFKDLSLSMVDVVVTNKKPSNEYLNLFRSKHIKVMF
ncbi:DeoR/GlpR family DNA-binding transcription regulator [Lactobacillus corticis]|uniref:DeoR family transcriptional regulator n=1 Tax=Lactobacillus corticis TaxID=2201249 RepID=A0A916VHT7_9LACO|nr:DeoR/GlpR family DNA-binding transcription regulator [Lactobacillus corticis]GFZ27436.1 DeoR family transcriptional regulator [Lactobacillus corticis]